MRDSQTDDTLPADPSATVVSGIASSDTAPAELLGSDVQLPNVEASSYELRELLGAGGMGKVVSKIAVVREHQLQAQLGIYRLATKLGKGAEATAARAAAQAINPARLIQ